MGKLSGKVEVYTGGEVKSYLPCFESEKARLHRNSREIKRRAGLILERSSKLQREVEYQKAINGEGRLDSDDISTLEKYVERKTRADVQIQKGYSNPAHPYWRFKCATHGTNSFNKRVLVPGGFIGLGFHETFSGCFCTKYKTHMLDFYDKPKEVVDCVEQANQIGHDFELVFIRESEKGLVERLVKTGGIKKSQVVLWMGVDEEGQIEARKDLIRSRLSVNALCSGDLVTLFYPPDNSDLDDSLTGLDLWMDEVLRGNLVEIEYLDKMYGLPYRLTPVS